ncbi:hypothetical protein [Streptomyces yangpuensis]|uniref:hypothetical protein n=1 Tax=Streptomyces yangpuensis TaxID=1648182 RepID=UPI0036856DCA
MLERERLKGRTQVTFVLPEDEPDDPVSVVGGFNHWNPAAHPLEPCGDGTRAAHVSLPAHSSRSFRYLAAGDYPFDDESDRDRFLFSPAACPRRAHPGAALAVTRAAGLCRVLEL